MNKIICTTLEYYFLHEIKSVTPSDIILKSGVSRRQLCVDKIEYTKSEKDSDAGMIVTESVKIKTGKETILTALPGAKLILVLHDSANNRIVVGTSEFPITYSCQQKQPEIEITFTVKH